MQHDRTLCEDAVTCVRTLCPMFSAQVNQSLDVCLKASGVDKGCPESFTRASDFKHISRILQTLTLLTLTRVYISSAQSLNSIYIAARLIGNQSLCSFKILIGIPKHVQEEQSR